MILNGSGATVLLWIKRIWINRASGSEEAVKKLTGNPVSLLPEEKFYILMTL